VIEKAFAVNAYAIIGAIKNYLPVFSPMTWKGLTTAPLRNSWKPAKKPDKRLIYLKRTGSYE
jgi:hypothetical protein